MDAVDRNRFRCQTDYPSFSSNLLDVIYRSIDERDDEESVVYRKSVRKKQSSDGCFDVDKRNIDCVRRSGGSKNIGDAVVRRKTGACFERSFQRSEGDSFYFNSNIGSSCSGYRAGLASSEVETIYGFPARPRPIRTSVHEDNECNYLPNDLQQNEKLEGNFVKKKSRAMKIYGYLKKGKQPISPGGRLATFLISLFTTANAKKSKISSPCNGGHVDAIVHANRESKFASNVSTSSSASSFSRSCLSKAPSSSGGKLTTGVKRSVRFYPANVIIGEYSHPHVHKSLHRDRSDSINEKLKKHLTEKNRHIEETTRTLLKNYRNNVEYAFNSIKVDVTSNNNEDDDDDDDASCASSDLFELDHLSGIGIDRCMQELPLYETTSVNVNRAIANGRLV